MRTVISKKGRVNLALAALIALAMSVALVAPVSAAEKAAGGTKIDVNTASVEELSTLSGIGPALAGRIVEHRKANGPFAKPEDLLAVRGVGAKLLDKIRDRLSFGGSKKAASRSRKK